MSFWSTLANWLHRVDAWTDEADLWMDEHSAQASVRAAAQAARQAAAMAHQAGVAGMGARELARARRGGKPARAGSGGQRLFPKGNSLSLALRRAEPAHPRP